jgi:hypothetical protein
MAVWQSVLLGAAGGGLVEVLAVLGYVLAWQRARRTPGGRVRKSPPSARVYVDVPAHLCVLVIRAPLGAFAAWLFAVTGQTSGPYAALAVGFAAPALLAQLGQLPRVEQAVQGNTEGELPPPTPAPTPVADQGGQVEREAGRP